MFRTSGFFIAVLLLVLSSGCASDSELDHLWRQGCGFNNPNWQRIKNGQAPVNLDGSVYGRR